MKRRMIVLIWLMLSGSAVFGGLQFQEFDLGYMDGWFSSTYSDGRPLIELAGFFTDDWVLLSTSGNVTIDENTHSFDSKQTFSFLRNPAEGLGDSSPLRSSQSYGLISGVFGTIALNIAKEVGETSNIRKEGEEEGISRYGFRLRESLLDRNSLHMALFGDIAFSQNLRWMSFEDNPDSYYQVLDIGIDVSGQVLPEPATFLMLGFGATVVLRRRSWR